MLHGPPLAGAEVSPQQLIEWGILLLLYFVGPAVTRLLKRRQEAREAAATPAAETAAEAEPARPRAPQPAPAPRPPPPEVAPEAVLPSLREALAAWHQAVLPRHGREVARRVEAVVEARVPTLATGQQLAPAEADAARALTRQIRSLTRVVDRLRAPDQLVLARAIVGLLGPVVAAREGSGGRAILVPTGAVPSSAADDLAEAAGLVLVPVGVGDLGARRAFAELRTAAEHVLRSEPERLQALVGVAWKTLVTRVRAGGPLSGALAKALTDPMAAQMLVDTAATAVVAHRVAPLGWMAMAHPDGLAFMPRTPQQAVAERAGLRSALTRDVMIVDLEESFAATIIAEAIEDALARTPWEGETGQALATLGGAWGPAEDRRVVEILAALESGASLAGPVDEASGAAAVVALARLADTGAATDQATARLAAALWGGERPVPDARAARSGADERRVAYARPQSVPYRRHDGRALLQVSPPSAAQDASALGAREVLALQIILGPPRARRHPAFRGGARSIWARPTLAGAPQPPR
ncbi:MAG: hypothetical protein H6744_08410 [Deltaproteobacteria bacterium]|nr:hypothetical protein [Deltaproteobacteria bacterium]MCB9786699.1 hypothetical protein [Deltaproteobacteria bacterium]